MLTFRDQRQHRKERVTSRVLKQDALQRESLLLPLQVASEDAQVQSSLVEVAIVEQILHLEGVLSNS